MRFGFIGCGLVAQFHGQAVNASEKAELVAVADVVPELAQKFAAQYRCEAAESIEALLARDDIEIVNVLVPNMYHGETAIRVAQAGKHVLVEKPPELTLEKVDAMMKACEEAGVFLGVVLQVRFRKAIEAIKAAIDAGRFGKLLQGDAYMKWYRGPDYYVPGTWRASQAAGAGVIVQHAFHYFDLLQYLLGPVKSVWARTLNLAHPQADLEDTVYAILDFENGAKGLVEGSTAFYPGTDIRIEINGENGTAIMQGERIIEWSFRDDQPEDEAIRAIGSEQIKTAAGGAADFAYFEHQYLIEDVIDAIRQKRPPRVTAASARDTLAIALAMYESGETGRTVELKG